MRMTDTQHVDLVSLISRDTPLRKVAGTNGGEFAGPCPMCGGKDRFRVWPRPTRGNASYWCRGCGRKGDAISYLRDARGLSFQEACDELRIQRSAPVKPYRRPASQPPVNTNDVGDRTCFLPDWQRKADAFVTACYLCLQCEPAGEVARQYLQGRCINPTMYGAYELGFNPTPRKEVWAGVEVWLPRGVVIPWEINGVYWNLRIRRLPADMRPGDDKYISVKGNANGLYWADMLRPGMTAVMVEGEFNAHIIQWTVAQHMRELRHIQPVATGSASGGRVLRWVTKLGLCRRVLTAFDDDHAGQHAHGYWRAALGDKVSRLPLAEGQDVNDMARLGIDLVAWMKGEKVA